MLIKTFYDEWMDERTMYPQPDKKLDLPTRARKLTEEDIEAALPAVVLNILRNVEGSFLAGGALRSMIDNTTLEDYDIYFKSHEAFDEADKMLSVYQLGTKLGTDEQPIKMYVAPGGRIQIMGHKFFAYASDCIDEFDFHCCMHAFYYVMKKLPPPFTQQSKPPTPTYIANAKAHIAAQYKYLTWNKIRYPLQELDRIQKYKAKGYKISNTQMCVFFKTVGGMDIRSNTMYPMEDGGASVGVLPVTDAGQFDPIPESHPSAPAPIAIDIGSVSDGRTTDVSWQIPVNEILDDALKNT